MRLTTVLLAFLTFDSGASALTDRSRTVLWVCVLLGAIVAAVGATILDNLIKGMRAKRAHNSILLINECIAEHHSAYLVYFIAMLSGTEFSVYWGKSVLAIMLFTSFILYCLAIYQTATQEEVIMADHACTGNSCKTGLKSTNKWKMIWVNILLTVLSLAAAITFAGLAVKAPSN